VKQIYLAHPLKGDIQKNLELARLWYKWACTHYWPDHCFNAMWILNVEVFDDDSSVDRYRGMQRNLQGIKRCDELWLLGPRVSEGMVEEAEFARRCQIPVYDLTTEALHPKDAPRFPPEDMPKWRAGSLTQQVLRF
jgi:hypothetical protein